MKGVEEEQEYHEKQRLDVQKDTDDEDLVFVKATSKDESPRRQVVSDGQIGSKILRSREPKLTEILDGLSEDHISYRTHGLPWTVFCLTLTKMPKIRITKSQCIYIIHSSTTQ